MKIQVAVGILAVVAAVVVGSQGATSKRWLWDEKPKSKFQYKNCGAKGTGMIDISSIEVSPDPIVLPGTLNIAASGVIKSTVDSPIKLELTVESKMNGVWVELPCVGGVGSCTFDDLCELLDEHFASAGCPAPLVKNNIPCTCPFAEGKYNLPSSGFDIEVPFFPGGEYHIIARLSHHGKSVACIEINTEIQ